jgi:hypothetical protein
LKVLQEKLRRPVLNKILKIELKSRSRVFFKHLLDFFVAKKAIEDFSVCKSEGDRKLTKTLTLSA